jgi:phosphoglycerol transferase MdoB-like AlkP superfamily enzyme
MGANARLFWVLTAFFVVVCVAYSLWTIIFDSQDFATDAGAGGMDTNSVEWVGTVGLALAAAASALIAFYVGRTHRAQGGELPEDIADANIDDGDPEQGFFSPWSWWPIALAASLALVFLGLAVGFWVAVLGLCVGVIAIVGLVFEYYRGYFSH